MRYLVDNFFQHFKLFPIFASLGLIILMAGCEDPGSVGDGLDGSSTRAVVDTFSVGNTSGDAYNTYSGNFSYFSAGSFNDPLLGKRRAIGMIKPSLPSQVDTVENGVTIKLRLVFNGAQVYGDSLNDAQKFNIYSITQLWRGKAWRVKDHISYDSTSSVGNFEVGEDQDTVTVALSQSWADRYQGFVAGRDSTGNNPSYKTEFKGLALVPKGSGKILAVDIANTSFVIENPVADTFAVPATAGQWAYNLDKATVDTTNGSIPEGSLPLLSDFEHVVQFSKDFSNLNVDAVNISKAELVFYANKQLLDQSLAGKSANTQRPSLSSVQLHLVSPDDAPENLDPGSPIANGVYLKADSAYHFNITPQLQSFLINGMPKGKFFVTASNNGIIKPTLVYGSSSSVPKRKRPKIIITHLENSKN